MNRWSFTQNAVAGALASAGAGGPAAAAPSKRIGIQAGWFSRKNSEMKLANLRGAGTAIKAAGLA